MTVIFCIYGLMCKRQEKIFTRMHTYIHFGSRLGNEVLSSHLVKQAVIF